MKKFYESVDKRSRTAMISFLTNHYRYSTADSCNGSTSYACNLKIHSLGLEDDVIEKLFELIQTDEFYDHIHLLNNEFGMKRNYRWQAKLNGKSGGYLVLCEGEVKSNKIITYCGQNVDMNEDFEDWSLHELRERVKLVCEFDKLADSIVTEAVYMAENYSVAEEKYYISHTRKVMVA
jgi:hypothetical protein